MIIKRYLPLLAILTSLLLVVTMAGCRRDNVPLDPDPPPVTDPTPPLPSEPDDDNGDTIDEAPTLIADRDWAFIRPQNMFMGDIWFRDVQGAVSRLTSFGDIIDFFWSPDGSQIAFLRTYDWQKQSVSIWIMDADGSDARAIDDLAHVKMRNTNLDGYLWSPEGSKIAYFRDEHLLIHDVSTGNSKAIYIEGGYANGPWWHPDGRYLALTGDMSQPGIYVVDIESGEIVLLPNTASPLWREDSLVAATYRLGTIIWDDEESKTYYRNYDGIAVYSMDDFSNSLSIALPTEIIEIAPVKFQLSPSKRYVATGDYLNLWLADLEDGSVAEIGAQDMIDTGSDYWIQFYAQWAPGEDKLLTMPYTETSEEEYESYGILELILMDMASGETQVLATEDFNPLFYVPGPSYIWLDSNSIYKLSHTGYSQGQETFDMERIDLKDMLAEGIIIQRLIASPKARPQ